MAKRQAALAPRLAQNGALLDAPAFGRATTQATAKDGTVSFFSIDLDGMYALNLEVGRPATASIGVANYPRDAKNADELARKAGLALYAAKEQGGDAVSLTPGENMILRSSYYAAPQLGRLRTLAERMKKKEAALLREALDDLLRKYDRAA